MDLAAMGRDLRARRRALGLTQSGLAEAIGARPVLLGRWERGEAVPTVDEVTALADALGLDPAVAAAWASAADSRAQGAPTAVAAGDVRNGVSSPARLRAEGMSMAPLPLREPSYLDDPVEQRRYARRWTLTIVVLGVLAVALIWALGELREGWVAFLDLFRGRPPTAALANVLGRLGTV